MKRKRSKLQRVGIATCGLSLSLFGCQQTGSRVDDGADLGSPVAGDPGGGGGGGVTDGGSDGLDRRAIVRPTSPTLFVADPTEGVMSFAGANTLDGNVAPTTFIDSIERVQVSTDQFPMTANALCVDRVGTLVINDAAPSLRFYNNAATVTGIPAPNREIGGLGSRLADNGGMAYDRDNDRLFVATSDRVVIFEGPSLSRSGEVAPTRVFSNAELGQGESIALGADGDLYVSDGAQSVLVFSNAGLRTGEVTADRVIRLSFFTTQRIFVDSLDRLYVTDGDEIAVLENAATLDNLFETFPLMRLQGVRAIDEEGSAQPEIDALVVDSRGIGYVADRANAAIHVIDDIGSQRGDIRTDRAIHGPAVEFNRPFAIFLWE